ncbi:hypothetical protein [Chloracidobacterium aggregatum]|uniref:hypothetical protein n=1 Tax=Chloracidobacterium aggregatum TaxID=2851959 RepID=UPI001B8B1CA8|nr:hypothetical protein [Chloracidobacterium aggregatum]QUV84719.1 hypothetical protein J8C03_00040 [Chloracidobacterium sp. 2]
MSSFNALPQLGSAAIREAYPRTYAAFCGMPEGEVWFERLVELDLHRHRLLATPQPMVVFGAASGPQSAVSETFDVIVAGGCFGLIVGATLAAHYGWRVLVFDRHWVGRTHRDWNISRGELQRLSEAGLFTPSEMEAFITAEYDGGFVKFHAEDCPIAAAPLWFDDVLTLAVSSDRLLAQCRQKLLAAGGSRCLDQATLEQVQVEAEGVTVVVRQAEAGRLAFRGQLFIDTMGTLSPIARQLNPRETVSYLCPTVGTIATGFATGSAADEVNARVGEILVTTGHAQDGRQLLWEGFAGRTGSLRPTCFTTRRWQTSGGCRCWRCLRRTLRRCPSTSGPERGLHFGGRCSGTFRAAPRGSGAAEADGGAPGVAAGRCGIVEFAVDVFAVLVRWCGTCGGSRI